MTSGAEWDSESTADGDSKAEGGDNSDDGGTAQASSGVTSLSK